MEINIALKSLAKKQLITQKIYVPKLTNYVTLAEFLRHLVSQQVQAFNERVTNTDYTPVPMSDDYLALLTNTGKVSFGDMYNNTEANIDDAIDNALQAYTDGLFAVFIDDLQIEGLDTHVTITEDSVISFIRLTFLTGSFW